MTQPKKDAPVFRAWIHDTLAEFAEKAYYQMQEDHDTIQQLKLDLRAALDAHRRLLVQQDKERA